MANKSFGLCINVLVALAVVLVGIIAFRVVQSPGRDEKEIGANIRKEKIETIEARLLGNKDLNQVESRPVDMTQFADLVWDLLWPNEATRMKKDAYSAVCELIIVENGAKRHRFVVIWPGTSKLLIANQGAFCYSRTGPYNSVGNQKYVDEPAAFCGMVQAVINKDESKINHYSELLRKSSEKPIDK